MKKIIALMAAAVVALTLVSCGDKPAVEPNPTPTPAPAVRKWEKTIDAAAATDNGDGTCSVTVKSQYSGGGMVVYLNEDKSDVAEGKKVTLDFDYETVEGAWKDAALYPKFCATLCKDITSIYSIDGCSDTKYTNGTALKGSMKLELTAKKAANEVFLKFNAYQWGGDADNDQLKITLKSIVIE